MRYYKNVKNPPLSGRPRLTKGISLAVLLLVMVWLTPAEARSSFWVSARDASSCIVSAVFQYERKFEERIHGECGITNPVILMDIHTREPRELCNMLVMRQGQTAWRPLLCVTEIRGNIYKGHLILPEDFALDRPIQITLGDRTIDARFGP